MKFSSEFKHFHSRKCTWKCCLRNVSHFVLASMCYKTECQGCLSGEINAINQRHKGRAGFGVNSQNVRTYLCRVERSLIACFIKMGRSFTNFNCSLENVLVILNSTSLERLCSEVKYVKHLLMPVIICATYEENPTRTQDVPEWVKTARWTIL